MSNSKTPRFLKGVLIAASSVMLMVIVIWAVSGIRDFWHESFPPPEITEIDDWRESSDSIESLQAKASAIVRGEVLTKAQGSRIVAGDTERFSILYTTHQVRVAEVFKGQVDLDNVIEIIQPTHLRVTFAGELESEQRVVFTPFANGDRLILFLFPGLRFGDSERHYVTSQSGYRYTPKFIGDWTFEGHDPRNDLILTANDLLKITTAHRGSAPR